jgi:hypothetical protein
MGNKETTPICFDVVQDAVNSNNNNNNIILISTLLSTAQECVIHGTKSPEEEERLINDLLEKQTDVNIIIVYGKNDRDTTVTKKIEQLKSLGLLGRIKVKVYVGGLFEWLLLQEIYGSELFKTTTTDTDQGNAVDLLKYK